MFQELKKHNQVSGNDNHIGDIGEYYVMKLLKIDDKNAHLAPKKNSRYDIIMSNGKKISVKTITTWSVSGKGAKLNIDKKEWDYLYAVYLNEDLKPEKIAKISYEDIIQKPEFIKNKEKREKEGTITHPRFTWWSWLDEYIINQ